MCRYTVLHATLRYISKRRKEEGKTEVHVAKPSLILVGHSRIYG